MKSIAYPDKDTRRRTKIDMVTLLGGKCSVCGYNKCMGALAFHHENPDEKEFQISQYRKRSILLKEVEKCTLLCSNCHVELHANEHRLNLTPQNKLIKTCKVHGEAYFYSFKRKGRKNKETCAVCMIERQSRVRRHIKSTLVEAAGGGCQECGYNTELKALEFHHKGIKKYSIASLRKLEIALEEIKHCDLLCKNCHLEKHWLPK